LKSVIVIGGGLAGLASGVALAEAGWRVRLFEQRPFLGGRATSYVLPDGEHVDNCQHVTFGCCTNLEDFYKRVGSANKIKFFDRLLLLDPQGRRGEMHAGLLPAPFHMTGSFLTFSPLGLKDKLAIARAFSDILRSAGRPADLNEPGGLSMLEWLQRRKQTPAAINRFWRAVLVSALSEELDRIDARYGIDVFWKAVLCNRIGYRMGVPEVALADLYDGCRIAIEHKGGEVTLRSPLRKISVEKGAVTAVGFDGDRQETADAYVFALPHSTMAELLPDAAKLLDPSLSNLEKLKDAPITGVHFWFDRQVMTEPFITLLDTTTQWIFNKNAIHAPQNGGGKNSANSPNSQYLQLVISASYDLLERPRQEIIDLCLKEVRQALPAAREANLLKATVIKEAAATFSPEPGVDRWRPKQETRIRGLFLAGDWTDTGWPATMEGAVRSGLAAARVALTPTSPLLPEEVA
jgi:squalene-associated FAD-dependent desaturase